MATQLTTILADYIILEEVNKMRDPMMLLITAIEHTKQLWEVYKTEEIRVYLEYLKGLYDRELEKLEK